MVRRLLSLIAVVLAFAGALIVAQPAFAVDGVFQMCAGTDTGTPNNEPRPRSAELGAINDTTYPDGPRGCDWNTKATLEVRCTAAVSSVNKTLEVNIVNADDDTTRKIYNQVCDGVSHFYGSALYPTSGTRFHVHGHRFCIGPPPPGGGTCGANELVATQLYYRVA